MRAFFAIAALTLAAAWNPAGRADESGAGGQNATPVAIDAVISEVEKDLSGHATQSCGEDWFWPQAVFKLGTDNFTWDKSSFCHPFRASEFCEAVARACIGSYGVGICWGPAKVLMLSPAGVPLRQISRRETPEFRLDVFKKSKEIFESLKKEPFLSRCCEHDAACEKRYGSTTLEVLKGLPARDETAYCHAAYDKLTVRVSEAQLLNSSDSEHLESVLMHEMGHACQYSHHDVATLKYEHCGFGIANWVAREDLRKALGDETAECVIGGLRAEIAKKGPVGQPNPGCMSSWLLEAYADALFSQHWSKLAHWAWSCYGGDDAEHSKPTAYLRCFFEKSSLGNYFCGGS